MYKNKILNNTLESINVSEDIFVSDWDKYTTLQTIKLIIDKCQAQFKNVPIRNGNMYHFVTLFSRNI